MKRLLLIGYRAYGDWLYSVPVLPGIFAEYEVHLETNGKGYHLFHDDPRFAGLTISEIPPGENQVEVARAHWRKLEEELRPDRVINLWQTLESECIAERYQPEFYLPGDERRRIFGGKNFYDAVAARCEVPPTPANLAGMHFTDRQVAWATGWRAANTKPVVLVVLAGSCAQKVYPRSPELILDLAEAARVYLLGDASTADFVIDHPNVVNLSGKIPVKQAILMTKYADFVFGGETGLLVAAGMWGTPKMMLCTSCSVYQACKYHANDFSLQANIHCSPCHRAIYTEDDCESLDREGEHSYPACTGAFDHDQIKETIIRALHHL